MFSKKNQEEKLPEKIEINLEEFIATHFQQVDGNVKCIQDAEVICLGEEHTEENHRIKNAKLIDSLYKKGHCLLLEEPYPYIKFNTAQGKYVKVNIPKEGWDLNTPEIENTIASYRKDYANYLVGLGAPLDDENGEAVFFEKYFDPLKKSLQKLIDEVEIRNAYMCERIRDKLKTNKKVYVIAGQGHFTPMPNPCNYIDYTSHIRAISKTRNFLKTKKFVILLPKN